MTEYVSDKIKLLSALLILMVVYIHMYYTEADGNLLVLQKIVGGGICSVAVPLFYLISGYLFFIKVPNGRASIFDKLKKRCRTLLVPYLLANILTFLFYVVLNVLIWKSDSLGSVVNFKVLEVYDRGGVAALLKLVFIDPPIAFQLWFIRDLIIVMCLSPIIYFLLKLIVVKKIYVGIAFGALLVLFIVGRDVIFVPAAFWFISGGLLSMAKIDVTKRFNILTISLVSLIYISMSILMGTGFYFVAVLKPFIPLFGVLSIWMVYDLIYAYNKKIVANKAIAFFSQFTFFVYLCHEPLLNIFKKIPMLINRSEQTLTISYFVIPIIFYIVACLFGYVLRKYMPKLYSIYTGGR